MKYKANVIVSECYVVGDYSIIRVLSLFYILFGGRVLHPKHSMLEVMALVH